MVSPLGLVLSWSYFSWMLWFIKSLLILESLKEFFRSPINLNALSNSEPLLLPIILSSSESLLSLISIFLEFVCLYVLGENLVREFLVFGPNELLSVLFYTFDRYFFWCNLSNSLTKCFSIINDVLLFIFCFWTFLLDWGLLRYLSIFFKLLLV